MCLMGWGVGGSSLKRHYRTFCHSTLKGECSFPVSRQAAQPGVSGVRSAASFRLSVAWLKSFNLFGVLSPDGALTSRHLLTLSL